MEGCKRQGPEAGCPMEVKGQQCATPAILHSHLHAKRTRLLKTIHALPRPAIGGRQHLAATPRRGT